MQRGFGIDTAFAIVTRRWRDLLVGEALLDVEIVGAPTAFVPSALIANTPGGRVTFDTVIAQSAMPRTVAELREDDSVWDHFVTQSGLDELRAYCGLPGANEVEVRRALTQTAWWRAFEEFVDRAIAYEWRAAVHSLAAGTPAAVCRPDRDDAPLSDFEHRLVLAAIAFEASSFDVHLLYDGAARVATLLMHMGP